MSTPLWDNQDAGVNGLEWNLFPWFLRAMWLSSSLMMEAMASECKI